jgi:hypothetical protein
VRLVEEVVNGRIAADLEALGQQDLQRGLVTVDMTVMVRLLWRSCNATTDNWKLLEATEEQSKAHVSRRLEIMSGAVVSVP